MKETDFDYNSNRERMILPEYGRNIQKLVKYLMAIESRDERNRSAHSLIQVMGNLNPHLRDVNDFKHKLWDHLAIISDFKIDIDSPYPTPTPETISEKPLSVPYGTKNPRFKHYGKNIEMLIDKACNMEEGENKKYFIQVLANQMKKFYLTWNKETVADDIIFKDLEVLSKGRIKLIPNGEFKLDEVKNIVNQRNIIKRPTNNHNGGHSNQNYRHHSNNNNNNNNNNNRRKY